MIKCYMWNFLIAYETEYIRLDFHHFSKHFLVNMVVFDKNQQVMVKLICIPSLVGILIVNVILVNQWVCQFALSNTGLGSYQYVNNIYSEIFEYWLKKIHKDILLPIPHLLESLNLFFIIISFPVTIPSSTIFFSLISYLITYLFFILAGLKYIYWYVQLR